MTVYPLNTPLSLSQADTIIEAALQVGRDAGFNPLTVVVLDIGGHLIAMKREDGSGIVRLDLALGKAWGALGMGWSSREIGARNTERPAFLSALAAAADGRCVPVAGSALILDGQGRVIGAVGVSGDTSDNDEICAIAGVRAAGLTPEPSAAAS